jgi:hypothetical protein
MLINWHHDVNDLFGLLLTLHLAMNKNLSDNSEPTADEINDWQISEIEKAPNKPTGENPPLRGSSGRDRQVD